MSKIPLKNVDYSCYVNSIAQIFLHNKPFLEKLQSTFSIDHNEPILEQLYKLRREYCEEFGLSMKEQCDAVFFLSWILDKIITRFAKISPRIDWKQEWIDQIICLNCQHKKKLYSKENIWICYPPKKNEKVELCELLVRQCEEQVESRCEKCHSTDHYKKHRLLNEPTNLFINLQNFMGRKVKIHESIKIKMSHYKLVGILKHKGDHDFGHYTMYLLDQDGWFHYNDQTIQNVTLSSILNNKAKSINYPLLWYTKCESSCKMEEIPQYEIDSVYH